jgi:hypothetical protein
MQQMFQSHYNKRTNTKHKIYITEKKILPNISKRFLSKALYIVLSLTFEAMTVSFIAMGE